VASSRRCSIRVVAEAIHDENVPLLGASSRDDRLADGFPGVLYWAAVEP